MFDLAIDLFICTGEINNLFDSEEYDVICGVAKYFKLKYNIDYYVSDGRLVLYEHTQKAIHSRFESLVKKVGGKNMLSALFQYLEGLYNHKFGRYVIHRNKDISGRKFDYKPIPYRYLFQLCLRHLSASNTTLDPRLANKLIRDGQKYVKLLQIYNDNAYSDIMVEACSMPVYLWENMYSETLCIPPQYAPKFVELIINELYIPKVKTTRAGSWFYTSKDLPKLICLILSYPPCSSITAETLHKETNVKQQTIKEILAHFSQKHDEVNPEYDEAIARTNTHLFPLIDLGNGEYYMFSSQFCGYAFCEKMHAELKR